MLDKGFGHLDSVLAGTANATQSGTAARAVEQ